MLNLQKNYLEKYQQIYPENAEWNTIQYKLQLNLGNASVELKKVYNVVNPYLSGQFDRQNKGFIISEVYLKPDELVGTNRIQRVCQKGFDFNSPGQGGMMFTIGQIEDIRPGQKAQYELLVVKICPRKTFPVVANEQTLSDEYRIPAGFDSIYYKEAEEDKEIYRHRFKICQKMQTLPLYLIQFSFNNAHQQKFKKVLCQSCQDLVATQYCLTEKTYFCNNCDFQHHKDKISSKHERKPLSVKPILNFGYCKYHRQAKNELFCRQCNQSLCISCKIYGTHADGPMASHQLQKISDYFDQIEKDIDVMDPNLQKRKDQLQEQLAVVDKNVAEINRTTVQIQQQLLHMFQDALKEVQIISRRKLSYLISDQLQIRRQYDYIQWMESFLKYEFNVLPPNSFLSSWTKHLKLRKQILNINNIPALTQIKPNFSVYGRVRVMESDKAQQYENHMMSHQMNHPANRQKSLSILEPKNREKDDPKQLQTFFTKKLLGSQQP